MSTEETVTKNDELKESLVIYEVGYLLLPTIAEEMVGGVVAKIQAVVSQNGGALISEDFPKMRALAYTMEKTIQIKNQKFDHAYFGWIKFEVSSSNIAIIKKSVDALEEVLRTIFIKTIRESTLMAGKVSDREAQKPKEEGDTIEVPAEVVAVKAPANEEDIDKSIEALVTN